MLKLVQGDVLELCFQFSNVDPVSIKKVMLTSKDLNLCEEAKLDCCGYKVRILGSRTKDFTIGFPNFDVTLELLDGEKLTVQHNDKIEVLRRENKVDE